MDNNYDDILLGQLFPNPPFEDGQTYLACVGLVDRPVSVKVESKDGKVVCKSVHRLPRHGGTLELSLPGLPIGSYDVLVRCGKFFQKRELLVLPIQKKPPTNGLFSWRQLWQRFLH